jgi:hypothetical protein
MRQPETKINRKVEKKKAKEHNTREQSDELKMERRQR